MEETFIQIIDKRLEPVKQNEKEIVYNCSLRKSDGDIKDWNKTSKYILALFCVFGNGLGGTGKDKFEIMC